MKVRVHRCSNRKFWYASYIGRELEVVEHSAVAYKLTDTSPPLLMIVLKADCTDTDILRDNKITQILS